MITIASTDHAQHRAPHEFLDGRLIPPYESPERAEIIRAAVERASLGPIVRPRAFGATPWQRIACSRISAVRIPSFRHQSKLAKRSSRCRAHWRRRG